MKRVIDNEYFSLEDGILVIKNNDGMDYSHYAGSLKNEVKTVHIMDGVTFIGYRAFFAYTDLTNITIPDSVTFIGDSAFSYCTSLTSFTIPNSVTTIGVCTFEDCTGLTSITIPDGVMTIGIGAFRNCTSLTSITIPDSVTAIGYWAFENCTSLTSITLPSRFKDNLKSMGIPDGVEVIFSDVIESKLADEVLGDDVYNHGAETSAKDEKNIENDEPDIGDDCL